MFKKKCPRSKFENSLLTRTVCPRRLSFSQFGVLMSTLNCEKDSLLGQMVLVKRPPLNFERGHIFLNTLYMWIKKRKMASRNNDMTCHPIVELWGYRWADIIYFHHTSKRLCLGYQFFLLCSGFQGNVPFKTLN